MEISETAYKLKKIEDKMSSEDYDLIVIGAGPSGMSTALCAGRADLRILLIEKAIPGGEASTAYKVDNYLGFPKGLLGEDLGSRMEQHLSGYNIEYVREDVIEIKNIHKNTKIIVTDMGNSYTTHAIVLATGLEPKRLNTDFEKKFLGRGVSYYARCDADFYKGKQVAVIGGGNCACYAADYLAQFVDDLYLIHRSDYIKAVRSLQQKVLNNPKIHVMWNSEIGEVFGLNKVEKIKVINIVNDQHTWLDVKGIFVYTGRIPSNDVLHPDIQTDEEGFIITDEFMRTNIPGVYASGDIRSKQVRQIATAVSDGMIAAINVERDNNRVGSK